MWGCSLRKILLILSTCSRYFMYVCLWLLSQQRGLFLMRWVDNPIFLDQKCRSVSQPIKSETKNTYRDLPLHYLTSSMEPCSCTLWLVDYIISQPSRFSILKAVLYGFCFTVLYNKTNYSYCLVPRHLFLFLSMKTFTSSPVSWPLCVIRSAWGGGSYNY